MSKNNKNQNAAPVAAPSNPRSMNLELFSFTTPDFGAATEYLKPTSRKNDAGKVVGLNLAVESRKAIAKALNEPSKSSKVTDVILATTDAMKAAALQEVIRIASSPEWTAASIRASVNKDGVRRAGFVFKTVDRTAVPRQQLVKALSMLSDEDKAAVLAEAVKMMENQATPVEVAQVQAETETAPETPAPEPQPAQAPAN